MYVLYYLFNAYIMRNSSHVSANEIEYSLFRQRREPAKRFRKNRRQNEKPLNNLTTNVTICGTARITNMKNREVT